MVHSVMMACDYHIQAPVMMALAKLPAVVRSLLMRQLEVATSRGLMY